MALITGAHTPFPSSFILSRHKPVFVLYKSLISPSLHHAIRRGRVRTSIPPLVACGASARCRCHFTEPEAVEAS